MFAPFLLLLATISPLRSPPPSPQRSTQPSTALAAPVIAPQAPVTSPATPARANPDTAAVKERTAIGAHFRVVVHFDASIVAEESLAAAEAVAPFAQDVFGPIVLDGDARLTIHVYATEAEYLDVESRVAHGAFARNLALTEAATSTSHVALQPPIGAAVLRQGGTPLQTKRCVAHEAVHAWSHRAWAHASALPFWFSEGAATWAADEALRARGWLSDPMEDPFASTNALRVRALQGHEWLPPVAAIVHGLPGGLTFDERYAVSGVVFAFLRDPSRAKLFAAVRDAARAADPKDDVQAVIARAFDTASGDEEAVDALQAAFVAHVRALAPAWDEVSRALWPAGDGWVQAAFATTNAIAWRTTPVGEGPYSVEGDVAILDGATRQMNVLLARTDDAFVQVSFVAGHGVDVFSFDRRRGEELAWKKLATAPVATLDAGRFHAFKVQVEGTIVSVWLDGKPVCSPSVPGQPLTGPFGLGALAGSSGLWRKIAQKRL